MSLNIWQKNIDTLKTGLTQGVKIAEIYSVILKWIYENEYRGGCHDTSVAMYIVLQESNIDCDLFFGEVKTENQYFDHSWVEINMKIYDASICMPLLGGKWHPPVFSSYCLENNILSSLVYGASSGKGFDDTGQFVSSVNLSAYSQSHTENPNKVWELAKLFGKEAGIKLNIGKLKKQYGHKFRTIKIL